MDQSINPGWTFGNIFINSRNSPDPQTELRIVQAVSYGRQLGRNLDAVTVLVSKVDRSRLDPKEALALEEFTRIAALVDVAKQMAESLPEASPAEDLSRSIESLARCLRRVKADNPELHATLSTRLREALQDCGPDLPDIPRLTTSLSV